MPRLVGEHYLTTEQDVDPWEVMGDEVMVAWDRDVAPLLTPELTRIEIRDWEGTWFVYLRGMLMVHPYQLFSACAQWDWNERRWLTSMLGWVPPWLSVPKYSLSIPD